MKYQSLKKYLPVVLVGGFLVLVNLFIVAWYFLPAGPKKFHDDIVPGKIVSVSPASLTTMDSRGAIKQFILTSDTKFLAGRNMITAEDLKVDTLVLVELELATTTPLVAREVRVMTVKPQNIKMRP